MAVDSGPKTDLSQYAGQRSHVSPKTKGSMLETVFGVIGQNGTHKIDPLSMDPLVIGGGLLLDDGTRVDVNTAPLMGGVGLPVQSVNVRIGWRTPGTRPIIGEFTAPYNSNGPIINSAPNAEQLVIQVAQLNGNVKRKWNHYGPIEENLEDHTGKTLLDLLGARAVILDHLDFVRDQVNTPGIDNNGSPKPSVSEQIKVKEVYSDKIGGSRFREKAKDVGVRVYDSTAVAGPFGYPVESHTFRIEPEEVVPRERVSMVIQTDAGETRTYAVVDGEIFRANKDLPTGEILLTKTSEQEAYTTARRAQLATEQHAAKQKTRARGGPNKTQTEKQTSQREDVLVPMTSTQDNVLTPHPSTDPAVVARVDQWGRYSNNATTRPREIPPVTTAARAERERISRRLLEDYMG